jgi:glycosyltransferase involved in cell wall biosynthesis
MKKIKVLQMPIANAKGGITQYALQNWKFIDKSRFQFDFATRSKTLDFADELIGQGCKIHYLSCSSEENEAQFVKEMQVVLDEGYDAIHLHTSYWKGFLVEELAIARKCPIIIVHSHSTMIDIADEQQRQESLIKHQYLRDTLPMDYATHFVACSSLAADWLFGEQIPRQQIHILNNAIDASKFDFSRTFRETYREKLGLDGCFVLGHVGRFVYQKNHDLLINIFREVYRSMPNARLLLVGGGELEPEIRRQVKAFDLESVVQFLGKRPDIPELLQAMDLFMLPSRFEGLPIVLIEAQAAGLKCLASNSISREAKITPNLKYISDNISDWIAAVKQSAIDSERMNVSRFIEQSGYEIRSQIKTIEKLYAGEDISEDCGSATDV